jgi:hypothetical protein
MEENDQDEKRQLEHVLSPLLVQVRSGISSSVDSNLCLVQLFIQGTVCYILWSRLFLSILLAMLMLMFSLFCVSLYPCTLSKMFGMKRKSNQVLDTGNKCTQNKQRSFHAPKITFLNTGSTWKHVRARTKKSILRFPPKHSGLGPKKCCRPRMTPR